MWCEAFAAGAGAAVTHSTTLKDGDVALFGSPRLFSLIKQTIAEGRTWYYGDKAYFGRSSYYRITKNEYMQTRIGQATPHRWESLGITINPWRKGSKILICPQSEAHFSHHGVDRSEWIATTTSILRQHTDRKIEIRYKGGSNAEAEFGQALKDVHAVIVFTSIAGVQAVMHGVPCFATHWCASSLVGDHRLQCIEQPKYPDNREELAWWLADNQWTIDEIKRGEAWAKLQ